MSESGTVQPDPRHRHGIVGEQQQQAAGHRAERQQMIAPDVRRR